MPSNFFPDLLPCCEPGSRGPGSPSRPVLSPSTFLVANSSVQAFVIYCFFVLLLVYLGGERSLLILLHGRPPKEPVFPVNLVKREIDVSDPYTFLFLKRGILRMLFPRC